MWGAFASLFTDITVTCDAPEKALRHREEIVIEPDVAVHRAKPAPAKTGATAAKCPETNDPRHNLRGQVSASFQAKTKHFSASASSSADAASTKRKPATTEEKATPPPAQAIPDLLDLNFVAEDLPSAPTPSVKDIAPPLVDVCNAPSLDFDPFKATKNEAGTVRLANPRVGGA